MPQITGLSDRDVDVLRQIVDWWRSRQGTTTQRPAVTVDSVYVDPSAAPEIYMAVTPAGGIPGPAYGTSLSTASTLFFQSAECQVYRLTEPGNFGLAELEKTEGLTLRVFNLSLDDLPEFTLVTVHRDKYGKWFASPVGLDVVFTGTGTGTGLTVCCGADTVTECFAGPVGVTVEDAVTGAVSPALYIGHNSSGTVTFGFGSRIVWCLNTTTTDNTELAYFDVEWSTATHATRKAKAKFSLVDNNGTFLVWDTLSGQTRYYTSFRVSDANTNGEVVVGSASDHYVQIVGQAVSDYATVAAHDATAVKFIALTMKERLSTKAEVYYSNAGAGKPLVGVLLATNRRELFGLDAEDLGTDPGADRYVKWDNTNKKFIFAESAT